ncbi:hypothetical protein B0H11DRAFT_1937511 [Mycena galericulata]|nr:hypothetical protein B0H11DRAFT_1937511 [Mycena galericulata]
MSAHTDSDFNDVALDEKLAFSPITLTSGMDSTDSEAEVPRRSRSASDSSVTPTVVDAVALKDKGRISLSFSPRPLLQLTSDNIDFASANGTDFASALEEMDDFASTMFQSKQTSTRQLLLAHGPSAASPLWEPSDRADIQGREVVKWVNDNLYPGYHEVLDENGKLKEPLVYNAISQITEAYEPSSHFRLHLIFIFPFVFIQLVDTNLPASSGQERDWELARRFIFLCLTLISADFDFGFIFILHIARDMEVEQELS